MSKVIALFDFFYGRNFSSTFIHKRTMLHSRPKAKDPVDNNAC